MAHALRLLVLSLLLSLSLASPASEQASKADLEAQKESLQLKIDSNQALTQKDIENLKSQLEGAGKRIDDQSNRIGDIGQSVDRFGIWVTVLIALGGLFGYFSVSNKAEEEARRTCEKWINDNQKDLENKVRQAETAVEQALNRIEDYVSNVEQSRNSVQEFIKQVQQDILKYSKSHQFSNIKVQDELRESIELIKSKPEISYSFDDWNNRAFEAFSIGQYEDAALYWKYAINIDNVKGEKKALAIFNRGISLHKLKRYEDEISTFKQLIASYSSNPEPLFRELVATALHNSGVSFLLLSKLEEARACYEKVITDYSQDSNSDIREHVVDSHNGLGYSFLLNAKKEWTDKTRAHPLLKKSKKILQNCLEKHKNNAFLQGNLSYVQWLLGDKQDSENYFRSALKAPKGGGGSLYHATLDDIALYPVPEDEGFRAMVERLWQEHQAQAPVQS